MRILMKKTKTITSLMLLLISGMILLSGCSQNTPPKQQTDQSVIPPTENTQGNSQGNSQSNTPNNKQDQQSGRSTLGGIHLGDAFTQVEQILGKDYQETFHEEPGHFPEAWYSREYAKGITVIVGKDSNKILEIDATAPDFPTNMGAKVGDNADSVFKQYGEKYKEYQGNQGDSPLPGFYALEEEMLIIFDLNKSDGMLFNPAVKPDSKVERIRLTYASNLD